MTMLSYEFPRVTSGQRASRLAAIDVGTNTVRLVIADAPRSGGYRVIDDEKAMPRLGRKSAEPGKLDPDAMAAAVDAVAHMCEIAKGFGVRRLRIVATAAVRDAENKNEFIDMITTRTGHKVEVISAEREAELACRSVAGELDLAGKSIAVADLGGGSTELVTLDDGKIATVHPLRLGAVRLTEQFGSCGPGEGKSLKELRAFVKDAIREETKRIEKMPEMLVGTGGTITTLAAMSLRSQPGTETFGLVPSSTRGHEVTLAEVRDFIDQLTALPVEKRDSIQGLSSDRNDIIVAGLAIAEGLMEALKVDRVRVHDRGVRDGLVSVSPSNLSTASAGTWISVEASAPFGSNSHAKYCHQFHIPGCQ